MERDGERKWCKGGREGPLQAGSTATWGVEVYVVCVLACVGSLNVCKRCVNARCVITTVHILNVNVAHAL